MTAKPPTLFSLLTSLLSEVNTGLHQAAAASQDQTVQFTIPKIEMQLKCLVLQDGGFKIVPSNAETHNYYGGKGESELKIVFKLAKV